MTGRRQGIVLFILAAVVGSATAWERHQPALAGQSRGQSGSTIDRTVAVANKFLGALDASQRRKANPELTDTTRANWSNLPTGIKLQSGSMERNGVKLAELTPPQQEAALALVAAPLSKAGYDKVMNIVASDQVLEERTAPTRQASSAIRFGRDEYFVAVLGTPSATGRWMLQFGGHHLAINVTLNGASSTLTPSHTGAQPASFTLDGRSIRPLGNENDKAFALINALPPEVQKQAILNYEVKSTVFGPGLDGKSIQPEGVRVSAFDAEQQAKLLDLVGEWVGILDDGAAAPKLADIKRQLGDTYFAWSGATSNGSPSYFRIQGPTVLIEYAPQGGGVDHIHTFYRDPTNDYGVPPTGK